MKKIHIKRWGKEKIYFPYYTIKISTLTLIPLSVLFFFTRFLSLDCRSYIKKSYATGIQKSGFLNLHIHMPLRAHLIHDSISISPPHLTE